MSFRFLVVFSIVLTVLFYVELLNFVQNSVVMPWTEFLAFFSASILHLLDSTVHSYGVLIINNQTGNGVKIEPGCNGVEAFIVLVAAILAYPSQWYDKLQGIVIGFFAIELLNVVRVMTLFYLSQWDKSIFEFAHLYLWQALIMLDALIFWLIWLRLLARRAPELGKASS